MWHYSLLTSKPFVFYMFFCFLSFWQKCLKFMYIYVYYEKHDKTLMKACKGEDRVEIFEDKLGCTH